MEGVHNNAQNQMTLHTTAGCTLSQPMAATGRILTTDCDVAADSNIGCGVQDRSTNSYGKGFNEVGGGVYVTYWDEQGISIWMFQVRFSFPFLSRRFLTFRSCCSEITFRPIFEKVNRTSSTGARPALDSTRPHAI